MYGEEVQSSVLHNVSEKAGYASLFIRLAFCSILLVHIPYYFLPAKECILLMYFEHKQRFLSQHLDEKLAEARGASKKKDDGAESADEGETDPMVKQQDETDAPHKRHGAEESASATKYQENDDDGLEIAARREPK